MNLPREGVRVRPQYQAAPDPFIVGRDRPRSCLPEPAVKGLKIDLALLNPFQQKIIEPGLPALAIFLEMIDHFLGQANGDVFLGG